MADARNCSISATTARGFLTARKFYFSTKCGLGGGFGMRCLRLLPIWVLIMESNQNVSGSSFPIHRQLQWCTSAFRMRLLTYNESKNSGQVTKVFRIGVVTLLNGCWALFFRFTGCIWIGKPSIYEWKLSSRMVKTQRETRKNHGPIFSGHFYCDSGNCCQRSYLGGTEEMLCAVSNVSELCTFRRWQSKASGMAKVVRLSPCSSAVWCKEIEMEPHHFSFCWCAKWRRVSRREIKRKWFMFEPFRVFQSFSFEKWMLLPSVTSLQFLYDEVLSTSHDSVPSFQSLFWSLWLVPFFLLAET